MAKQNYFKLALVIVLTMAAATSVYAATSSVGTSIGGSSFSVSNKVSCYYDSDGTTAFEGTSYAIACGHLAGDKVVSAVSGDAKLYFKTTAAGSGAAGAADITAGMTYDPATWSSM